MNVRANRPTGTLVYNTPVVKSEKLVGSLKMHGYIHESRLDMG